VAAVAPVQTRLFRSALLLTNDRSAAEDLVSETIAAVYGPWVARRVEDLAAYLYRALHNRFRTAKRREARLLRLMPRLARPSTHEDPANDERDGVLRALSQLSPRQRATVVARYYDDLSVADCAALLGVSEGTIKSTCSDALARLRGLLTVEAPE
jgi:RNA polymerase sigma factor (sigma-70 family)